MNRCFIQYYSRTLASLAGVERQQILPLPVWEFSFPSYEMRIVLNDAIKKISGGNLHNGLNMIVDIQAESEEEAKDISKNSVEFILNLVSFSTLAYCNAAKLVSIIDI